MAPEVIKNFEELYNIVPWQMKFPKIFKGLDKILYLIWGIWDLVSRDTGNSCKQCKQWRLVKSSKFLSGCSQVTHSYLQLYEYIDLLLRKDFPSTSQNKLIGIVVKYNIFREVTYCSISVNVVTRVYFHSVYISMWKTWKTQTSKICCVTPEYCFYF